MKSPQNPTPAIRRIQASFSTVPCANTRCTGTKATCTEQTAARAPEAMHRTQPPAPPPRARAQENAHSLDTTAGSGREKHASVDDDSSELAAFRSHLLSIGVLWMAPEILDVRRHLRLTRRGRGQWFRRRRRRRRASVQRLVRARACVPSGVSSRDFGNFWMTSFFINHDQDSSPKP